MGRGGCQHGRRAAGQLGEGTNQGYHGVSPFQRSFPSPYSALGLLASGQDLAPPWADENTEIRKESMLCCSAGDHLKEALTE